LNTDEISGTEEDLVVVKRPMSSKKSKSLENVNKILKKRKLSLSNKGIIDIYKR
jgi:hypothetical protein